MSDDYLDQFMVQKNWIHLDDANALRHRLDTANNEHDMQVFLQDRPEFLAQLIPHTAIIIPQKRLGAEYVPDFLLCEICSAGHLWTAVEIESPHIPVGTKAGEFTSKMNHAVNQITFWRAWLGKNASYASRDKKDNGLGLTGIDNGISGLIIAGRRAEYAGETNILRRQFNDVNHIRIISYDNLVEWVEKRARVYEDAHSWFLGKAQ